MSGVDLFGHVSVSDTGERSELDFYETPAWMTYSLLYFHPSIKRARVLEPCAGRDAISDVLVEHGCTVYTNDIDERHPAQTQLDATLRSYWKSAPMVQWVVTNPPYAIAFDILTHAKDHAMVGVALMLGKNFSEPTEERGGWLHENPPTRVIGQPRHKFRGEGSPPMASDWFIWERQPDRALRPFEIDHVAKTRRSA